MSCHWVYFWHPQLIFALLESIQLGCKRGTAEIKYICCNIMHVAKPGHSAPDGPRLQTRFPQSHRQPHNVNQLQIKSEPSWTLDKLFMVAPTLTENVWCAWVKIGTITSQGDEWPTKSLKWSSDRMANIILGGVWCSTMSHNKVIMFGSLFFVLCTLCAPSYLWFLCNIIDDILSRLVKCCQRRIFKQLHTAKWIWICTIVWYDGILWEILG